MSFLLKRCQQDWALHHLMRQCIDLYDVGNPHRETPGRGKSNLVMARHTKHLRRGFHTLIIPDGTILPLTAVASHIKSVEKVFIWGHPLWRQLNDFSVGLQRAASPLPGFGVSPKNFFFSFCSPPAAASKEKDHQGTPLRPRQGGPCTP